MKQFWVGYTESGFAKWLAEKNPENDSCPYAFFSNDGTGQNCEEIAVLSEVEETRFKAYSPLETASKGEE